MSEYLKKKYNVETPTITIVGAGALGSHLVLIGRNWAVYTDIIDFDRVETKNIQSQFHTSMGQGKNKAVAIQAAMRGLFRQHTKAVSGKLAITNQAELLGKSDLIVDCTDNYATRRLIQDYCAAPGAADCIHGCLSADGTFARFVWTEQFEPDEEDEEGAATCEDGRNLPFHIQAAALGAQIIQMYLDDGVKQSWQITPYSVVRLT